MAFARHNVEKHRLIEMVRMNPILWDCRLPHYKRSDKKKDLKWCELGRAFNVSGERVQRTFTSLREIFRRELNHEKMLGDRFTSKWEFYEAMNFLRDVIRERKTKDRFRQTANKASNDDADCDYPTFALQNRNPFNIQPDVIIDTSATGPDNSLSRSTSPGFSIKEEQFERDDSMRPNDELSLMTHGAHQNPINGGYSSGQNNAAAAGTMPHRRHAPNAFSHENPKKTEENSSALHQQTPREILYTKFGEFLAARLNTLNETASNDLMNRILMLIAET